MENNTIPPVLYEKLVKKLRIIKIFQFFTIIFCCLLVFSIINNFSEQSLWPLFILAFLIVFIVLIFWFAEAVNKDIVRGLGTSYNWSQEINNNDVLDVGINGFKSINKAPKHIVKDLEKFHIYGLNPFIETEFLLKGNFCNRNFCL